MFRLKFQRIFKGIEFNEQKAIDRINQEYADNIILEDFYYDLTFESKLWIEDFFNRFKPEHINEFDTFFQINKHKSIMEIKKLYEESDSTEFESKRVKENNPKIVVPFTGYASPDDSSLTTLSKFVITRTYGHNQHRMTVSTPDQSLYLQGRFHDTTLWFPHYENVKKNWSGPAAGQSILAWYSVPLKNHDEILTKTKDIQAELADLLRTGYNDHLDYTKPADLRKILTRDEFLGSKGYCYYRMNATVDHIHHFLSHGNPVIILLAWDKKMHYVTVYGQDEPDQKYWVANAVDPSGISYDDSLLKRRWNFSDLGKKSKVVTELADIHPNMLFAYNDGGCNAEWDYIVDHHIMDDANSDKKNELYFDDFNEKYVDNSIESYIDLNFYGKYEFNPVNEPAGPLTKVSSGGKKVSLHPANHHIIAYADPPGLKIDDNSLERNFEIELGVDKIFLEDYPELGCAFRILDADDHAVKTISGKCLDLATSLSNHTTYIYNLTELYQPEYRKVEFLIHEGWRKKVFILKGCDLDNDHDFICDDEDEDDDNDGFIDLEDNCPAEPNPLQTDQDGNGLGFECDFEEQCKSNCDPGLFTDNLDREFCEYKCAILAGSEFVSPLSVLPDIRALEHLNVDIHDPGFKKSPEFNEILTGYEEILDTQGIKVHAGRNKRQLLKLIDKME